MSTKIYNGYISTLNIEQLLKEFVAVRDKFEKKKVVLYNKVLARAATMNVDREAFNKKKILNGNEQYEIYNKTQEGFDKIVREEVILRREISKLDFSLHCSVIPLRKGKTLLLLYCQNKEMTKMWEKLKFIKDYHYQDQTDKPRNISEKNWEIRKNDWDKALGWDTAAARGYTFDFTFERLPVFIKRQDVVKFIPDDNERIDYLMRETYIDRVSKKLMDEDKEVKTKEQKASKIFTYFRMARESWDKYKNTKAYEKDRNSIKKYISQITFDPTQVYVQEKMAKAFNKLKKERGIK